MKDRFFRSSGAIRCFSDNRIAYGRHQKSSLGESSMIMTFRKVRGALLCAASISCSIASTAGAQEWRVSPITSEDEEIIVTGINSRLPAELAAFPGSVTVIAQEAIEAQFAINTDVGALLSNEVPGLATSNASASDFGQTLRGRSLSYYVDGVPISVPLRDAGRSLRAVAVSAIAGVEVVRGATALYGNGGNGGSVNYITKRPKGPNGISGSTDLSLGASLTHTSDSFNPRTALDATIISGNFDMVVAGAYEKKAGFFDAVGDRIASDPGNGGISDSDIYNLYSKLGYNFGDQRVEVSAMYYDQKQDTDYGLQILGNQGLGIKTRPARGQLDPRVVGEYNRNLITQASYINENILGGVLRLQGYRQKIEQRFGFNAARAGGSQAVIESRKDGARLDLRTPLMALGLGDGDVMWGAEYVRDRSVQTVNTVPRRIFVPQLDQQNYAVFAQLEAKPVPGLTLQGGGRYDHFDVAVDDFSVLTTGLDVNGGRVKYDSFVFNVGAVQELVDGLNIFAGFSQGFSLPDIGLSIRATRDRNPLVTLRPEPVVVNNYEVGIRGKLDSVEFTLAGFISTSKLGQSFAPDPADPLLRIVVRAAERLHGLEGTLRGSLLEGRLDWGGTISWVSGRTDTNGDDKLDAPLSNDRIAPLKATGYLDFEINSGWSARLQGLYSGHRNKFPIISQTSTGSFGEIKPFFTLDASTTLRAGPGDLTVAVANILNNQYFAVNAQRSGNRPDRYVPSPGATARISYRMPF